MSPKEYSYLAFSPDGRQLASSSLLDNTIHWNVWDIGKPATSGDASNGFIAPATLATCVSQAKAKGWDAGVMVWEVSLKSHCLSVFFKE